VVVRAYAVCIRVTPECRRTESEMIRDGRGHADEVDKAYHDITPLLCRYVVGGITVPSINRLWSPVWRLSACLESGIIYNILFNMQNPSKILLKLKLGNSKVLQITS